MTALGALLVDLDGTLADTREANWRAYRTALAEIGIGIERDAFLARAEGRNWREFLPAMMESGDPQAVARRKAALYPAQFSHVRLNHALLALIRARGPGVKCALVTTASRANASGILAHFGLAGLFDTIVTGDDVARHKPAPDAYVLAADRLGVAPADCVVFEDSDAGVAAGEAFGAPVLRVRL